MTPAESTRLRCLAQEKRDHALSLETRGLARTAARLWEQADALDARAEALESETKQVSA